MLMIVKFPAYQKKNLSPMLYDYVFIRFFLFVISYVLFWTRKAIWCQEIGSQNHHEKIR